MKLFILFCLTIWIVKSKLYQVVSLTRHGARYHVNDFGDGNDTKPLWGELTSVGMRQHQKLGEMFRKEYI
jgi:broad specificity phosphatase PhoE